MQSISNFVTSLKRDVTALPSDSTRTCAIVSTFVTCEDCCTGQEDFGVGALSDQNLNHPHSTF